MVSMNEVLGILAMCCSLCFVVEGIEKAVMTKTDFIYKLTHIGYPIFVTWTLFYYLAMRIIT